MVAGRKVEQITMRTTVVGADPKIADRDPVTRALVIEYSGYGTPVSVQRP